MDTAPRITTRMLWNELTNRLAPLEKTVSEMEARLGKYHTAAQLQQNPTPREGVIFKKSDWRYYHAPPAQIVKNMEEVIWSWDCAFKGSLGSDNVAGLCIGRRGADKYLLARVSEKMTFSKTLTQVKTCRDMPSFSKKTVAVLVEDKANGPAVIATLRDEIPGLVPVQPDGGKEARLHAVAPLFAAGNVWLPHPAYAPWVSEVVSELVRFPRAPHDDDVDACTQALSRLSRTMDHAIVFSVDPSPSRWA